MIRLTLSAQSAELSSLLILTMTMTMTMGASVSNGVRYECCSEYDTPGTSPVVVTVFGTLTNGPDAAAEAYVADLDASDHYGFSDAQLIVTVNVKGPDGVPAVWDVECEAGRTYHSSASCQLAARNEGDEDA